LQEKLPKIAVKILANIKDGYYVYSPIDDILRKIEINSVKPRNLENTLPLHWAFCPSLLFTDSFDKENSFCSAE
jgi:hypothetical protein